MDQGARSQIQLQQQQYLLYFSFVLAEPIRRLVYHADAPSVTSTELLSTLAPQLSQPTTSIHSSSGSRYFPFRPKKCEA